MANLKFVRNLDGSVTRKYVHSFNKDVIEALKCSIDKTSGDWLESFIHTYHSALIMIFI